LEQVIPIYKKLMDAISKNINTYAEIDTRLHLIEPEFQIVSQDPRRRCSDH